jgi:hypothetical protein
VKHITAMLVAAAIVSTVTTPAVAADRRKRKAPTATQRSKTKKSAAKTASANMPKGFAWPPNAAMKASGDACKASLTEASIEFTDATPQKRVPTPIELTSLDIAGVRYVSIFRKPPFIMDCHLAAALVQHSDKLFALGVREVRFSRIYGYTKVRTGGKTKNMLSRHALGMAMDIYSVVDETGRVAVVGTDYKKADPLLLAVEQTLNESHGFRTVLSPKNDPRSHHDHFHIEAFVDFAIKPTT